MNKYLKNLNRIEFVVTNACTGRCKHCSQGDHGPRAEHIDADAAAQAVREICAGYKIKSLMTFGGEPLLHPEVVCKIHKTAAELAIPQRDLITNGFFTKDRGRIREVVEQLADSGICKVLLSVDAFHQETIPLGPVKFFAGCAAGLGMSIALSPAWLVREEDNNPYNIRTREVLNEFSDFKIPVAPGNIIFPSGNAAKYLGEYFDKDTAVPNPYTQDPRDIRAISFSANGDVLKGNIYQSKILDIINRYEP